jgi:hypothetical protein
MANEAANKIFETFPNVHSVWVTQDGTCYTHPIALSEKVTRPAPVKSVKEVVEVSKKKKGTEETIIKDK